MHIILYISLFLSKEKLLLDVQNVICCNRLAFFWFYFLAGVAKTLLAFPGRKGDSVGAAEFSYALLYFQHSI
jgi:hypothetical protein